MNHFFWVKRFLLVLLPAFAVIAASQVVQDRGLVAALVHGVIWAPITAAMYVAALRYRNLNCKACEKTPSP